MAEGDYRDRAAVRGRDGVAGVATALNTLAVAIADREAEIEHDFERDDVATVGGLVLAEFGRVPRAGESITVDGWEITVEVTNRRRVRRVVVAPPVRAMSPDGESEE